MGLPDAQEIRTEKGCMISSIRSFGDVIDFVSQRKGINVERLLEKDVTEEASMSRHITVWLGRMALKLSLHQLGRQIRRDHSTVFNSIKRVNEQRDVYSDYRTETDRLLSEVRGLIPPDLVIISNPKGGRPWKNKAACEQLLATSNLPNPSGQADKSEPVNQFRQPVAAGVNGSHWRVFRRRARS